MEQGRVMGFLLKSLLQKGSHEWLVPSLFLLCAGLMFINIRLLSWSQFFFQVDPLVLIAVPFLLVAAVGIVAMFRSGPSRA